MIERYVNRIAKPPPYHVSHDIRDVHNQLTIVDLHADSLLWNRDLLRHSSFGHVDIPRLSEGNVAIQVFGVVTKFPFGMDVGRFSLNIDMVRLLSVIHGWPRETRNDLLKRAIYQSNKLDDTINGSNGRIKLIRSINDLDHFLVLRKSQPNMVGALLALEGAHALQGKLPNLHKLYDSSFRIFGISHFFDNEAGGSAHGKEKGGLSAFGRGLIHILQKKHTIIDLSHASGRVLDEVLEMVGVPVMVSHTGVCGICNNPRNLSDDQVRKIAEAGGIIGVALFEKATCGRSIRDAAHTVRYVADLAGVDCIGVGSDFDGAITTPFDASGWPLLTRELFAQGFNKDQIAKIMGGNALRLFRETLP